MTQRIFTIKFNTLRVEVRKQIETSDFSNKGQFFTDGNNWFWKSYTIYTLGDLEELQENMRNLLESVSAKSCDYEFFNTML